MSIQLSSEAESTVCGPIPVVSEMTGSSITHNSGRLPGKTGGLTFVSTNTV